MLLLKYYYHKQSTSAKFCFFRVSHLPPPLHGFHRVENFFLAKWFLKETSPGNPILTFYTPDASKAMGKANLDDHG